MCVNFWSRGFEIKTFLAVYQPRCPGVRAYSFPLLQGIGQVDGKHRLVFEVPLPPTAIRLRRDCPANVQRGVPQQSRKSLPVVQAPTEVLPGQDYDPNSSETSKRV